jgi:hypothetical protein
MSGSQTLKGRSALRIVIFQKKAFPKYFACLRQFFKIQQILLTHFNFLKFFASTENIGDDHHKYGKIGTKHELIDRLQS